MAKKGERTFVKFEDLRISVQLFDWVLTVETCSPEDYGSPPHQRDESQCYIPKVKG